MRCIPMIWCRLWSLWSGLLLLILMLHDSTSLCHFPNVLQEYSDWVSAEHVTPDPPGTLMWRHLSYSSTSPNKITIKFPCGSAPFDFLNQQMQDDCSAGGSSLPLYELRIICDNRLAGDIYRVRISTSTPSGERARCVQFWSSKGATTIMRMSQAIPVENCSFVQLKQPSGSLWMPSPKLANALQPIPCPITGGFQVKNVKINPRNSICPQPEFYAYLESECIMGEGLEWSFHEKPCNPFQDALVTKFRCYHKWQNPTNNHSFVLLYTSILTVKGTQNLLYTLAYMDIPPILNSTLSPPRSFYPLYLTEGFTEQLDVGQKFPSRSNVPVRRSISTQFRRAYGDCDDMSEGCQEECENFQIYSCRRTCRHFDLESCRFQRDQCKLDEKFQGRWRNTLSDNPSSLEELIINEQKVTFTSTLAQEKSVTAQCVQKLNKGIEERFILNIQHFHHGCRRRDVCLELYQSPAVERSLHGINNNSILYRVSGSTRVTSGLSPTCNFAEQQTSPVSTSVTSASSEAIPLKEKILVHVKQDVHSTWNLDYYTVKCGLYQMLLHGNATATLPTGSSTCSSVTVSDFNETLFTTGEFDNHLNLQLFCEPHEDKRKFQQLTEKQICVSAYPEHRGVQDEQTLGWYMRVLYSTASRQISCWLMKETKRNPQQFIVFVFNSVDCHFTRKPHLVPDAARASFVLHLTATDPNTFTVPSRGRSDAGLTVESNKGQQPAVNERNPQDDNNPASFREDAVRKDADNTGNMERGHTRSGTFAGLFMLLLVLAIV